jgi:hypothetical protein
MIRFFRTLPAGSLRPNRAGPDGRGLGYSAQKIALLKSMSAADLADFGAKAADVEAIARTAAGQR